MNMLFAISLVVACFVVPLAVVFAAHERKMRRLERLLWKDRTDG